MTPQRIRLSRAKGWRIPPNTVKAARPSQWGNLYRIGDTVWHIDNTRRVVRDAAMAARLHREWLEHWLKVYPGLLESLRGKDIACWCGLDKPCHVDTILELSNR